MPSNIIFMAGMRNLLIVGASARAAAQSAHRAGFAVDAVDLFADEDLAKCAMAVRCDDYPGGLVRLAHDAPAAPWMYTGGLENHPRIVAAIAAERPLWGNDAETLRAVRDPVALCEALSAADLPAIDVRRDLRDVARDGSWLAKPIAGSGGLRVHVFDDDSPLVARERGVRAKLRAERWYFQRRHTGIAASAVFVAAKGRATLLGMTEQLVGQPWTDAGMFQYAGSIGPFHLDGRPPEATVVAEVTCIGELLAAKFRLTGLFGVDGMVDREHFWPVEVNPRHTASCEIIERMTGINAIEMHVAACADGLLPTLRGFGQPRRAAGKVIAFATRDSEFGEEALSWVRQRNAERALPRVADIPAGGSKFVVGQPIVTLLTKGHDPQEVRAGLASMASELRARLS